MTTTELRPPAPGHVADWSSMLSRPFLDQRQRAALSEPRYRYQELPDHLAAQPILEIVHKHCRRSLGAVWSHPVDGREAIVSIAVPAIVPLRRLGFDQQWSPLHSLDGVAARAIDVTVMLDVATSVLPTRLPLYCPGCHELRSTPLREIREHPNQKLRL